LPQFIRRILQGWLIAKVIAWFRRSRGGGTGSAG
jgi:hypothetical protein